MEDINIRLTRSAFELAHLLKCEEAIQCQESKYDKMDYLSPTENYTEETSIQKAT